MLNVLYKNRNNDDKLKKYIEKNGKKIVKEISRHKETKENDFSILNVIENHIFEDSIIDVIEFSESIYFKKRVGW